MANLDEIESVAGNLHCPSEAIRALSNSFSALYRRDDSGCGNSILGVQMYNKSHIASKQLKIKNIGLSRLLQEFFFFLEKRKVFNMCFIITITQI